MNDNLRHLIKEAATGDCMGCNSVFCHGVQMHHDPRCFVAAASHELEALEAENEHLRTELAEAKGRRQRRGMAEAKVRSKIGGSNE